MSPKKMGRPTANPKNIRLEIRLTQEDANILEECSKELNTTKTAVIQRGIRLVRSQIKK